MSEAATVYRAFAARARAHPGRAFLNVTATTAAAYGIAAGEITYGDMLAEADDRAQACDRAGLRSGMRVGVLVENRPVFFALFLALNKLGASIVPVNPELMHAELDYLIGHSEPALIVALPARHEALRAAARAAGRPVPVTGPDDPVPAPFGEPVAGDATGAAREAAVLYTSGTTGSPKGCVLSNAYFLVAGEWYAGMGGIGALADAGERMITPLPLFHMNAMAVSFMAMVSVGGCLTVLDRFHPSSWWQDVAEARATCLHYLGVMPSILMNMEPGPHDRAHSVKFGFGAGIDPKLHEGFEARFGFPLIEAWAMTETGAGAVIAANRAEHRMVGRSCLGKAEGWVDARVVKEDGQEAGPNEPGELLVRNNGPDPRHGFFSHYYKNPQATAEAWQGGWFHTGDLVRRDAQGNFFFVDRKKNVIRRSGENIAAVEVESVLMRHPAVEAAGVAPVPDAIRGDEVFACLKVADPSPDVAVDIAEWALGQMAYYKVPGYIAFVDELPLTPTQKIQRASLKALAAELLQDRATVTLTHLKKRQVA